MPKFSILHITWPLLTPDFCHRKPFFVSFDGLRSNQKAGFAFETWAMNGGISKLLSSSYSCLKTSYYLTLFHLEFPSANNHNQLVSVGQSLPNHRHLRVSCIKKYNENALGNSPQDPRHYTAHHHSSSTPQPMQQKKQKCHVQCRSKHKDYEATPEETMFE